MKKVLYVFVFCIACFSSTTHADTNIGTMLVNSATVWTKSKSPYVIQGNVTVSSSGSLTIEAGVSLIFKSGSIFSRGGTVSVIGTKDKVISIDVQEKTSTPLFQGMGARIRVNSVSVTGLPRPLVHAWNGSQVFVDSVSYTTVADTSDTWISIFASTTAELQHLSLSGWHGTAIESFQQSVTTIKDCDLQNVGTAVHIFDNASSTISGNVFTTNNIAIYANTPYLNIYQNDFEKNQIHIYNIGPQAVAIHNWWDNAQSLHVYANRSDILPTEVGAIVGDVLYVPVLLNRIRKNTNCCSSVLFFPGMMGSRLYVKSLGMENQLWEPNRNGDVKKLFLNAAGQSALSGIYTRDIINRTNVVFGAPYIDQSPYKDFSVFMNTLVQNGSISNWSAVPYDWRFAPDTVLDAKGVDLENTIVALAQKSKTKKVTLISHSNGGLLIKQLMIHLKAVKLEHLIDKIVLVALPEYGTPQAVTSLLFGHEQSIAKGLILKSSVAKDLGKNMPTAYSLLPSDMFFSHGEQVVLPDHTSNNMTDLEHFLNTYKHINTDLLHKAQNLHAILDTWVSPVPVLQIVGTGISTVTGIQKVQGSEFVPTYSPTGDGTVLDMFNASSHSFSRSGTTVAVDLTKEKDIRHMNIMNAPSVQKYIRDIIQQGSTASNVSTDILLQMRQLPLSYKVAKISASSTLQNITLQKESAVQLFDTYKSLSASNFDYVAEVDNQNRYELFDGSVLYLNSDSLEKFAISQQDGGVSVSSVDISLFEREGDILHHSTYSNIPINPVFAVSVSGAVLSVKINRSLSIEIGPDTRSTISLDGGVHSDSAASSIVRDRAVDAAKVRTQMIREIESDALRKRYLTRLDAYAATGDLAYLNSTRTRIQRAIGSISRFDNNPALRGRYASLKADYQFLAYLFYFMSPDRPAHMQFVSP